MLTCYSINHDNAPLAVREILSFSQDDQQAWLAQHPAPNAVLLATCNRVELYADVPHLEAMAALWEDLLACKGMMPGQFAPYTVKLRGYDAAHHLFQVASSLKSLALGEAQILGQTITAFEQSSQMGACGHHLSLVFRAAIHAAKRVHHETPLGQGHVSVSGLGITRIEQVLGDLTHTSILVIGSGEMGQAVVKGLARRHVQDVTLVSRTYERAREVAEHWHIHVRPMTALKDLLVASDVVFTTSNAPFPILTYEDLEPVMALRGGRPLYLVDVAVPRDVSAEVERLAGVHLYNLDALEAAVALNRDEREKAIPQAQAIIEEELSKLWQTYEAQEVVPTIRQLRAHMEQIRQAELERILNRLPAENGEEMRVLFEEFSQRFMNKILHQPTHNLKRKASQGTGALFTSLTRDLFELDNDPLDTAS